jgi:hypothetical protein
VTQDWEVEYTDQFERWWIDLTEEQQERVAAAVEFLGERGPSLGRPFVDGIKSSRHPNMKELIPLGGNLRILFAFDAGRTAILLMGGDKTDRWREWYANSVPLADDLYDEHLEAYRAEGRS